MTKFILWLATQYVISSTFRNSWCQLQCTSLCSACRRKISAV